MKNRWMKLLCLCLAACLCVGALAGCDGKKPAESQDPVETGPVDATNAPTDYSKYNAYIDLADEMAEIEGILEVYFANVAYQPEFALVEGGDYANLKEAVEFYTGLSYTAEKALDYADDDPSYPDADAAVLALGDSVEKVMDALDHLGSYMRFDDYVDDNLARAAELHTELWNALETYDAHYPEFLNALADLDEQTDAENMEQLKESGQTILYQSQLFLRAAQDIQDGIWDQISAALDEVPEGEDLTLPAIDMTALAPIVEQFNTAYQDLTTAMSSQEEQEKVPAFAGKFAENSLEIYSNRVDGLYVKTGALVQILQEGGDYGEALDDMGEAINDLIGAYNNVI